MNYRSNSDYEQYGHHRSWDKEKPSKVDLASPKSKMIASTSNTSELHRTLTAMTVSPSGERITCPIESLESSLDDTNPFKDSVAAHDDSTKFVDNSLPKLPSKYEKLRHQNRRKTPIVRDHRRKLHKIILKQESIDTARKYPKCAAVQTDASMILVKLPESIGDGRKLSQSCMDLTSTTTIETINSDYLTSKLCLSENQRKFLSFLLMVILIFWLTSIILDVEIPAEFCRIALNYIWSLKSIFYYEEKPLTFTEQLWKYIKYMLE